MDTFGVMIACYPGDAHFAQASFQSIRRFLGDNMPVCFIVDGDPACLGDVLKDPLVSTVTRADVQDPRLRECGFGWGYTKMVGLWHSPFQNYLYMDADAIVWGDVVTACFEPGHDFIIDQQQAYTDAEIDFWFFSTAFINTYYPDFDYGAFRSRYACSGTFLPERAVCRLKNTIRQHAFSVTSPKYFLLVVRWGHGTFLSPMAHSARHSRSKAPSTKSFQLTTVMPNSRMISAQRP